MKNRKQRFRRVFCAFLAVGLVLTSGTLSVFAEDLTIESSGDQITKDGKIVYMRENETIKIGESGGYYRIIETKEEDGIKKEVAVYPDDKATDTKESTLIADGASSGHKYVKTTYTAEAPDAGKIWKMEIKKESAEKIEAEGKTLIPYTITRSQVNIQDMKYKIVYDANGGEGKIDAQEVAYDTEVTLSDGTGLTYPGKVLKCWSTMVDGKKVEYPAGGTYKNSDVKDGAEIIMSAEWGDESVVEAEAPVITTQPVGAEYTKGATNATPLSVAATVSDGGSLSYQWYVNTTNSTTGGTAVGNKEATYTPSVAETGTLYYYCVVKNTNKDKTAETISDVATITVKEEAVKVVDAEVPSVKRQEMEDSVYDKGTSSGNVKSLVFEVEVSDGGEVTYQWYKSTKNSTDLTTATEVQLKQPNTKIIRPGTAVVGTFYYFCVATNTNPNATGETTASVVSDIAKIKIEEKDAVVNAETPTIKTDPAGATYYKNARANAMKVEASAEDDGELSYQWYKNTKDSNTGGTAINGATSETYTPSTATIGTTYYYCVVTNTNKSATGRQTATVTSKTAKIVVKNTVSGNNTTRRNTNTLNKNGSNVSRTSRSSNAKTLDESNLTLWILMMAAAGSAAAVLIIRRRKRYNG